MFDSNRMRLTILALCGFAATSVGAAQNVGVVDTQVAILQTAEIQKAQAAMETDFKPRQDAIAALQRELQDIQQQLQKMAGKLTPQAERDLQLQSQRKQRELQRKSEDLETDVGIRRNDTLEKVGRKMREVIQKLAEERGLDVVIDVTNTLYYKPALDLTKEATAAYNAANPVE